jgi:hypothetical protein
VACCVDVWACFMDCGVISTSLLGRRRQEHTFGVNCKSSSIDGLLPYHNIAIFIHENEIRDTDLRKVLRKRVEPEVVRQNRIPDRDMARHSLVETSFCESKRCQSRFESKGDCERGAHILKAAARCCLRYSLSSSKVSNFGYERILSLFPETVFPSAPSCEFASLSPLRVVAVGAILYLLPRDDVLSYVRRECWCSIR